MILRIIYFIFLFCSIGDAVAQNSFQYQSFVLAQNVLIEQQFSPVFENYQQSEDTVAIAFDNQSFYWTNFNKTSTLFIRGNNTPVISAKKLYELIGKQTIEKLALNLNHTKLLVVSTSVIGDRFLYVIDLINKHVEFQKNNIHDAAWVNNVSIFYATNKAIEQYHSTFETTKSVKTFTENVERLTFTNTWDNCVFITLNYANKNDIWLINQTLLIQKIKLITPNNGVFYTINKCQNKWICAIKSGSDYDQLLTTTNINTNTLQWESVVSSTDEIYIDNLTTTPERILITGYEKGNAFIRAYEPNFSKPNNIKFDEQIYALNINEQPYLQQNKLIINNRIKGAGGFIYDLINETIQNELTDQFETFNNKLYTAKRSEVSWGKHIAYITEVHRNRVKKPTNCLIIKPVSAPKEQLRNHFTSDELKLLELGYGFALVHVMPNSSLLNINNNQTLFGFYPEVGLFYATQRLLKNNPSQKLVVLANEKSCNAVLNTAINHPTIFNAVILNNPQFESLYANFSEKEPNNLTTKEKEFIANKKIIDPLANIIYQLYPPLLFNLTNKLPNKSLVAIYNKIAIKNAAENQQWCYTKLHNSHLNKNLSLIINFIEQSNH